MDTIRIFDTTLRDGEQSPGASMTVSQKVKIAHQLEAMGVDSIEAGFPISSPQQFESVERISKEIKTSTITALARAVEKDIDSAAEALKHARSSRIHTFLASSPIHRKYKLKKDKSQILEMVTHAVSYARNKCDNIEFSPEDATRTELDFLAHVVDIAIQAGATIINIPDTVGYSTPWEMFSIIEYLKNNVPNIDKAIISTHCHDDLGLAVANTLSAIKAGARQAEVTINGIGERAGNAALEEIVMALNTRKDFWNINHSITTSLLYPTAKLLSTTIGFPIPRNKAIVGENAFAHESGIHQDGILKHRKTYEIMTAEAIGRSKNTIVLGRHSGMHGLKSRLTTLNIDLNQEILKKLYERFVIIADKKKEIFDEDLYAMINDINETEMSLFQIRDIEVFLHSSSTPKAKVTIEHSSKEEIIEEKEGDGPVDAIFNAISAACKCKTKLIEFHINAITPGTNAMGEAAVVIEVNAKMFTGRASSTDIIKASAHAYISAINNSILFLQAKNAQMKKQTHLLQKE